MWGAAAMSLSSFCVCMNALRLNFVKVNKSSSDHIMAAAETDNKNAGGTGDDTDTGKEKGTMEKVISIEGMMCEHCEATVKKALEQIDGVESAEASHEKNQAVVSLSADVADDVLKKAVEDHDYKVTGIE